jgi:hypothetical protein
LHAGVERLADTRLAEQPQAVEVVAPVVVVDAVGVGIALSGVVLPEAQPGSVGVVVGELEAERILRPRIVPADALPDQRSGGRSSTISIFGLKSPTNVKSTTWWMTFMTVSVRPPFCKRRLTLAQMPRAQQKSGCSGINLIASLSTLAER